MRQKRCFFIGHRDAPADLYPSILAAVEEHIVQYGVTEFLVGQYGAFDRMAAKAVIQLKEKYPEVVLTLLLAYHPDEKKVELPKVLTDRYIRRGRKLCRSGWRSSGRISMR